MEKFEFLFEFYEHAPEYITDHLDESQNFLRKIEDFENNIDYIYNNYYSRNYSLTAAILRGLIGNNQQLMETYNVVYGDYEDHTNFRNLVKNALNDDQLTEEDLENVYETGLAMPGQIVMNEIRRIGEEENAEVVKEVLMKIFIYK